MLLFVLVSLLMVAMEAFLLVTLRLDRTSSRSSARIYISYALPIAHLLPWLAGVQSLRQTRRAVRSNLMSSTAGGLCYSITLAMLATTYVVLGLCEIAVAFIWRLGGRL